MIQTPGDSQFTVPIRIEFLEDLGQVVRRDAPGLQAPARPGDQQNAIAVRPGLRHGVAHHGQRHGHEEDLKAVAINTKKTKPKSKLQQEASKKKNAPQKKTNVEHTIHFFGGKIGWNGFLRLWLMIQCP